MIPYEDLGKLNAPFFEEYRNAFSSVLESGWYILGNQVKAFEQEFSQYVGTKHCIGVASGLDALILSLDCLNIPAGSEVIVPSNTYIATILSISKCGLKPVLVEPDYATCNIDPNLIEEAITEKTRAVMIVHLYGLPCDMEAIMAICEKHGLKLIEDCAQSHGATVDNRMTGTFGDFGAFSFYPTKNLGALGDGGAICTDNDELAEKLIAMRNYGSHKKYYNKYLGLNSRLDEMQAAFLRVKLKHLDEINTHKKEFAAIYDSLLTNDVVKPVKPSNYEHVYHIYNIRCEKRDELKTFLEEKGLKTEIHYPLAPNKQEAMKGILDHFDTPIADKIHNETLSLPISFCHTSRDIEYTCKMINEFYA